MEADMSSQQRVQQHFQHSIATLRETLTSQTDLICAASEHLASALLRGGKVLVCGNGGSAALAQYMSSLLINRFERERPGLPAVALTSDSLGISSIAAESHYKTVYAHQIRTLGQACDILLVIASSRNSANLREAIAAAYDREMPVVLLSSEESASIAEMLQSDGVEIRVPGRTAHRTLEAHLTLIHCLCDLIDIQIFGDEL
jgi:D-sedoheptulose 7-phosphate isomerase